MSSSNSVTVQILDKEYSIICPQEERSNLVSAARYLDGKMREDRKSTRLNSSHIQKSRMPSSA